MTSSALEGQISIRQRDREARDCSARPSASCLRQAKVARPAVVATEIQIPDPKPPPICSRHRDTLRSAGRNVHAPSSDLGELGAAAPSPAFSTRSRSPEAHPNPPDAVPGTLSACLAALSDARYRRRRKSRAGRRTSGGRSRRRAPVSSSPSPSNRASRHDSTRATAGLVVDVSDADVRGAPALTERIGVVGGVLAQAFKTVGAQDHAGARHPARGRQVLGRRSGRSSCIRVRPGTPGVEDLRERRRPSRAAAGATPRVNDVRFEHRGDAGRRHDRAVAPAEAHRVQGRRRASSGSCSTGPSPRRPRAQARRHRLRGARHQRVHLRGPRRHTVTLEAESGAHRRFADPAPWPLARVDVLQAGQPADVGDRSRLGRRRGAQGAHAPRR